MGSKNYNEKALGGDAIRSYCALAVGGAKNFRPAADPLPGGAGRPKFNQLQMVTTHYGHYLYLNTQFGEDRSIHAISSYRCNRPAYKQTATNPHTYRTDYNTLRPS